MRWRYKASGTIDSETVVVVISMGEIVSLRRQSELAVAKQDVLSAKMEHDRARATLRDADVADMMAVADAIKHEALAKLELTKAELRWLEASIADPYGIPAFWRHHRDL